MDVEDTVIQDGWLHKFLEFLMKSVNQLLTQITIKSFKIDLKYYSNI